MTSKTVFVVKRCFCGIGYYNSRLGIFSNLSMAHFFANKEDAIQCADDIQRTSQIDTSVQEIKICTPQ